MFKIVFVLALFVLGFIGYSWYQDQYNNPINKEFINLTLGNDEIEAEVVRSFASKTRGLSGRDGLAPNTGMLFVFTETRNPEIWMKDMKFAIDIIFINKESRVVALFENATPESYFEKPPKMFRTLEAARYVLEVPAGTVQDARLRVGMSIDELTTFK
jgi:uncharacterized membrane protein (UPF0127 family)